MRGALRSDQRMGAAGKANARAAKKPTLEKLRHLHGEDLSKAIRDFEVSLSDTSQNNKENKTK